MNNDIQHIGQISSGVYDPLTIESLGNIATLYPEAMEWVDSECHSCKAPYRVQKGAAGFTACEACCDKWDRDNLLDAVDQQWRFICPKNLRDTDRDHEGFPAHVWKVEQGYTATESLFLYGPTRSGKTRLATQLIHEVLLQKKTATMVWPEELKEYAKGRERLQQLQRIGGHDVILLDDALLTGAQDERIADFLKDLIDFAMRNDKRVIITSQIGATDYAAQADKFNNMTATDRKRIDALLARIMESFRVIAVLPKSALPPPTTKSMF